MNASVLLTNLVAALLLPPLNAVLLVLLGLMLRRRLPRVGVALVLLALAALTVFSTFAGARWLHGPLERTHPPLQAPHLHDAQAIVLLGGGRIEELAEYGGVDIPFPTAFLRMHYAARLHRQTGLPVLASGGVPDGAGESEAAMMARMLHEDYAVPVQWLEERSNNTAQNAKYTAAILLPQGLRRILLVTDAMHMARATAVFERAGFEVVPAPTARLSEGPLHALDLVPNGEGLRRSHYALRERIGQLWYRLRH
ncbi:MAG TPA: YdcF family protein [Noviherbaspirillum sp.]|nr:YdcF family protein [Noviherbaspirillum sp.]